MPRKKKKKLEDMERVWAVGIDPGLNTTAMVLTKRDVPVAAVAVQGRKAGPRSPLEQRCRQIALFCMDYLDKWCLRFEIENLFVQIETSFLRPSPKGRSWSVRTLMSQMTLYGMLVSMLYELYEDDSRIWFAPVHNQTVKATFTGDGNASKSEMVQSSAWYKRPDVECREHLADAQAIAGVYGECFLVTEPKYLVPCYVDSTVGKGALWANRWPANGRNKLWHQY